MVLTIDEIKDRVIPIVQSHGVNSFSIFGSYARNEATDESDLDFIMDDGDVSTLVKYIAWLMIWKRNLIVMLIWSLHAVTIRSS